MTVQGTMNRINIKLMYNFLARLGSLCQQDIDALANNGSLRIDENSNEALTSTGREELLLLGRRYRGRFPAFFNVTYKPKDYQVTKQIPLLSYRQSLRLFDEYPIKSIITDQVVDYRVGTR